MKTGFRTALLGGSAFPRGYDDGHGLRRGAPVFESEGHSGGGTGGGEVASLRAEVARLQSDLQAARQELGAASTERATLKGQVTKAQNELEAAKTERTAADASTKQAHDAELVKLRGELDQAGVQFEFRAAALAAGVHDADSAVTLGDLSGIKKGQDGKLSGVAEAVEALRTAKPFLFAEPVRSGAQTGNTASPNKPPVPTQGGPVDARTMSPAEYKAARAQTFGPMH